MNNNLMLSIANDYSAYPAGRVDDDGDFNGEKFREKVLVPKLNMAIGSGTKLIVSLDGLKSCGSSFLESAFGGLVRYGLIEKKKLMSILEIKYTNPALERYKNAIDNHIKRANPE